MTKEQIQDAPDFEADDWRDDSRREDSRSRHDDYYSEHSGRGERGTRRDDTQRDTFRSDDNPLA